jgi:hypothetical protein
MTVDEAAGRLREFLLDAGFDFARPNPALAWEVFQRFAAEPVDSAGGPWCEELWFEASEGDPVNGSPGFFDFVRQFLQDTEQGAEFHEQITAHFSCDPGVRLGLRQTTVHAEDLTDLPAFFRAVEASASFRAGLAFAGWSFEVRVDAC